MSKIKEFENIPEIDIDGAETLEEAVEDCKPYMQSSTRSLTERKAPRWRDAMRHGFSC